jgi:hypothetical protein
MVMVAIPQFSSCQYEAPSTAILVCFLGLIFSYIGKTVEPFCVFASYGWHPRRTLMVLWPV